MKVGVVGLGDMGSGMAKNLIANGFAIYGVDRNLPKQQKLAEMGGTVVETATALGGLCDAVFVMVMNGAQAQSIVEELIQTMEPGGTILLTATIKPAEARVIGQTVLDAGLKFVDSPVSGGFPGAQSGTLTMMAAAPDDVLDDIAPVMQAVSANIHRVGTEAGDGQTVKACLQSLIGAQFSATFEAAALAAKAGVPGQVLLDVFSTSSAGCGIVNNALEKIIDRQFKGTGSHINTMHKDLTIAMGMAEELGVPLHTAGSAMQIFTAGKTKHPDGDNWAATQVIEDIVGAELHRDVAKKIR